MVTFLLVREHRIVGPGSPGIQGLGMGKGWHAQRCWQGRMDRGTIAVIGWTRRSRLRAASVYNAHQADLGREEVTRAILDLWQT